MISGVISVLVSKRTQDAAKFQEVLTRHGCNIKTRLGVHEVEGCREDGLVILHAYGTEDELQSLTAEINGLAHTRARLTRLDF